MNKGQNWVGGKYIEYMPDPSVDPYEVRPEDGYDCWAETTTTPGRSVVNSDFMSHLTDTGEDSKLVHRRKRPKVDTLFSCLFPTRPSDEYDSAPSRKYSRPLLDISACIG